MRTSDLVLEVRDRNLKRVGQITGEFLNLKARVPWCGVGQWELTLPGDHPMAAHLSAPGSGVILSGPTSRTQTGVMFSGPTLAPNRKRSPKTPRGTLSFKGVTDTVLLDDASAYPSPAVADGGAQTAANDTRTGPTETLLRGYVGDNIASAAPAARRSVGFRSKLTLQGADAGRGLTQTKSPRFQNLLELCREIVTYDPAFGFDIVQQGAGLVFRVIPTRDLRKTIRFDIANGTLTSEESQTQGASLTRAIVAGQGEGTARTIITRTAPGAAADEALWGRVIERFIDKRDTDDLTELMQAGDEALIEAAGGASVKIIPADEFTMQYAIDWREGDRVSAIVDGAEVESVVTEAVMLIGPDGIRFGAAVGNVTDFDAKDATAVKISALDSRVGNLERASQVITAEMLPEIPADLLPAVPLEKIPTLPWSKIAPAPVALTNWDDVAAPGWYYGDSAANAPFPGAVMGMAHSDGSRLVVEALDPAALVTRRAVRVKAGAWASWVVDDRAPAFLIAGDKGNTTVPNNAWTFLNFPVPGVTARNDGFTFDTGRVNVPKPGIYDLDVSVRFGQTASGEARLVRIMADGASTTYGNDWRRTSGWVVQQQVLNVSAKVPVTGYFQVQVYHNSGADMAIAVDNVNAEWRGA